MQLIVDVTHFGIGFLPCMTWSCFEIDYPRFNPNLACVKCLYVRLVQVLDVVRIFLSACGKLCLILGLSKGAIHSPECQERGEHRGAQHWTPSLMDVALPILQNNCSGSRSQGRKSEWLNSHPGLRIVICVSGFIMLMMVFLLHLPDTLPECALSPQGVHAQLRLGFAGVLCTGSI